MINAPLMALKPSRLGVYEVRELIGAVAEDPDRKAFRRRHESQAQQGRCCPDYLRQSTVALRATVYTLHLQGA